ncbi:hypothetical protein [Neptunicella sp. SCSIO 80796]|uniref:hypothetical protein n=1 Tax=Neptunicella plasticusilytica TaxID=3117012 RepID=UPI003A4D467E
MGITFWIKRTLTVFVGVVAVLFIVELLKGHAFADAIEFALLWGLITTAIFTATRLYYSRKGVACALCDDIPSDQKENS